MKLFELYNKRPLREDKTLQASIKLCESVVSLLEDGLDFDVNDPDIAKFAGVKGVTRDTGAGNKEASMAQHKQQEAKLNKTWVKLLSNLQNMSGPAAQKLKIHLKKVADVANKRNFTLSPPPEKVLGL